MWLKEGNRLLYLLYAVPTSAAFTILFATGFAIGTQFKESIYGQHRFDWLDVAATLIGGTIGQTIQLLVILIAIR